MHLQYILTELLKNAFRATVEKHLSIHNPTSSRDLPPVLVTISPPPRIPGIIRPSYLSIRVRDEGGGVPPSNMSRIFSYAFSTAAKDSLHDSEIGGGPYAAQQVGGGAVLNNTGQKGEPLFGDLTSKGVQTSIGILAGLGYGLPMSRLYAR